MDIDQIKEKVRNNQYMYSYHAEIKRKADKLTFAQVEAALRSGVAAGRVCWGAVCRWRAAGNEYPAKESCLAPVDKMFPCPGEPEGVKRPYALPKLWL